MTVLTLEGAMPLTARYRLAANDITEGFRLWPLAWSLGWLDIRLRYRGSLLGPFWLTLSTAVMVTSLGVLYAALFHLDVKTYLPFLALSQVLWGFIAALVNDACVCFTQSEDMIRAVRMPFTVHAIRTVVRNVFILAHNIVVIVAVAIIYSVVPGWSAWEIIPGLVVWAIDGLAVCLALGAVCARFRDIGPIVGSIMQIAFFLTPIIWQPEQLGGGAVWLIFNPFYSLMEIVRAPLLGHAVTLDIWQAALGYSAALCALAWLFFVKARSRVAFWI